MKKYLWVLFVLLTSWPVMAQQMNNSVYIEDMTWKEVRDRIQKGAYAIIIPTGGTEQNGPQLAIGKHNAIANYTSGESARQLKFALVAPVIKYVPEGRIAPPDGHMKFPGTISVSETVFAGLLEDTARSFKQHGFKLICFMGDHGGSQEAQKYIADKLNNEWKNEGVRVLHVSDYYASNGQQDWVNASNIGVNRPEAHAGFFDTSELWAIDSRLVRPELRDAYTEKDYLTQGASGDSTKASELYGQKLLALKVSAAVKQIQRAADAITTR